MKSTNHLAVIHLVLATALIWTTTACATTPAPPPPRQPIPGVAPVSMADESMHQTWSQRSRHNQNARTCAAETQPMGQNARALPAQPERAALREGFLNVERSVGQCLSRVMKRDGELPAEKISVLLTIAGSGQVKAMQIDRTLRKTPFGKCLKAHSDRWRFEPWAGAPIKVRRSFVLEKP